MIAWLNRRWLSLLPFGLLGAVLLVWLWRLLIGETLFWGLPALQFYPWRSYAFDMVRELQLPLWNVYNGGPGGAPLLANYQTAVFYPPNWLHLILPHVTAMNLLAVGHIVWAAIGMWAFGRASELPRFGRGVSMLAFALGGYLVARIGSFPSVAAASWLPWMLVAVRRLMARSRCDDLVILAVATGFLLLAGHAQTAYYVLLASGLYALWLGIGQRSSGVRTRLRRWMLILVGILLGAGVAAVQLAPTADLLLRSDRAAGLDYGWTTNFSFSLARGLTLFAPNLYGTPADGSYITEGAYFEDAAYIGLPPLVAALFGGLAWWRSRRAGDQPPALRDVPFWLGLGLLAFLIALGKNGPLFPLLYQVVPTFKSFQGPVRWLLLTVFALSYLGGVGVSYGWHKGRWTVFWSRLIAAGGAGMALVAGIVAPRILPPDIPALHVMVNALVLLGLGLSVCAGLTLLKPSGASRWVGGWQAAVLVFVAVDLGWASYGLNPTVPAEFFAPIDVDAPAGWVYMPEALEQHLKFEDYFPLDDYRVAVDHWREVRASLLPNLNLLDRVPMINNFDPMVTAAYAGAIQELEASLPEDAGLTVVEDFSLEPSAEPFGQDIVTLGAAVSGLALITLGGLVLWDRWRIARRSKIH
jgi:hypothetical protein